MARKWSLLVVSLILGCGSPFSVPRRTSKMSAALPSSACSSLLGGSAMRSFHSKSSAQRSERSTTRSALSMHMGHSHSHHHHHDHGDHSDSGNLRETKEARQQRRRRRLLMVAFAATLILGPPSLMKKRALTNADGAAFLLSSVLIASADKIRSEVRGIFYKLQALRNGLVKHAPPAMTTNPMDYFKSNSGSSNVDETTAKGDGTVAVASTGNPAQNLQQSLQHHEADRVTVLGVVVNLFLSLGKFVVGVTCHSSALLADAGHSLSDLFSDFVTLYSVQLARLPPDDDHPYGHGKFEAIGSLFLALTLIGTGTLTRFVILCVRPLRIARKRTRAAVGRGRQQRRLL